MTLRSQIRKEGDLLVHQTIYKEKEEMIGYSNIKIYARDLKDSKSKKSFNKFDRANDIEILYLCGHLDGYDGSDKGFIISKEKFTGLMVHLLETYGLKALKPIRLKKKDIEDLIKFLYNLKEKELLGEIENQQDLLRKWTMELIDIIAENKVSIFIELYEYGGD